MADSAQPHLNINYIHHFVYYLAGMHRDML